MFDDLGYKLKKARKVTGLTQADVASRLGVSDVCISNLETRQHRRPPLGLILKLSTLYEVSLDYLLKDEMDIDSANEAFVNFIATNSPNVVRMAGEFAIAMFRELKDTQDLSATPDLTADAPKDKFAFDMSLPK